ncbi:MAG TPA: DUF72 domain-containing protein [Candidatus Nanopelagicales bacterium]|nr:DUF72 domain-containing protein [Candidatus Nanopelagicales bacterium]
MAVHVGVSGWSYERWRGDFYPEDLPRRRELEHIASRLDAVEVNATHYRLQRPSSYLQWLQQTPEGFRFALKGSRYITHLRSLRDCRTPLANFLASGPLLLGERLGPLLWQLPAGTAYDEARLDEFFALLPRSTAQAAVLATEHDERVDDRAWLGPVVDVPLRHVLEPRHPSFGTPQALDLLRRHGIGLVVSDGAGVFPMFDAVTSDTVYVRLHGPRRLYHGGYTGPELDAWAQRVRGWEADGRDVWVFFDNDADGRAPYDAQALASLTAGVPG